MSEETKDKLFTKFSVVEAVLKDPLFWVRLYIVRSIIEKHGGSIEFASQLEGDNVYSQATDYVTPSPTR